MIPRQVRRYIDELIEREGEYVDHPSDRGGPTRWGITQFVARAAGYTGDMRELPREFAFDIYLADYWLEPRFNDIEEIDAVVAVELFDTGVNAGPGLAGKFLQRALTSLNMRGAHFPDLVDDGVIGKRTLEAMRAFYAKRGARPGRQVLMRLLDAQQAVHYLTLAQRDQKQEDFMFGWVLHRVGGSYAVE